MHPLSLWASGSCGGQSKPKELTDSAESEPATLYEPIEPSLPLGLPFSEVGVSAEWSEWPSLPDLFPTYFPGVQTKRDSFLIDTDLEKLKQRIAEYFNPAVNDGELTTKYPVSMKSSSGFVVSDAQAVRSSLLARGGPLDDNFVLHSYRPLDTRWLYWEAGPGLLGRPVPESKPHYFEGNIWLVSQNKPRRDWSPPQVISEMGCLDLFDRGATCFPAWLRNEQGGRAAGHAGRRRERSGAPTCRRRSRCTWTVWVWEWRTCFITRWRCCTTRPTGRPTPGAAYGVAAHPLPGWPDGDAAGANCELLASAARAVS